MSSVSYGDNKHFEHIKLPMTWAVMGVVGLVCIIAALMLLGDRSEQVEAEAYAKRSGFDSAAGPVNNAISWPVQKVGAGTNWLDDYFFAVSENRVLRTKVAQLSQYENLYKQERDLNSRYEKLLNLRTEPEMDMVAARSVSVSRGPFANNRLIDAGSKKGITFGNPVITDQGLVGRIVGVSPDVSRVLMVTDVTSHVPVMVMRSDARAMMNGDGNTGYTKLDFVRGRDSVRVGDQILTSGDGGIFPRGLPVGEAVKGVDGVWRVRLYSNRAPIELVKVVKFKDFSQLPDPSTLLRSPPVSDILPPPAMPRVDPQSVAQSQAPAPAAATSSSASPAATPARPVNRASSSSTAPRPRPAAASSSSSSSALPPEAAQTSTAASSSPAGAQP
ncbi:rod shape-determining protein MreC [Asticcacaulis sp. AC402]|uniref:rod shape-determining protein MreC n=1 Tax=Asticcacaulis sp. AC402 TaxID=1282361 RepID=UPI0003C3E256|nr:rod shape-determining protein MreC [Asticcacaulis sp. AC402]ESQ75599.1 rod shape-determining protein MreC [Asticcacaulis sp. AC402]